MTYEELLADINEQIEIRKELGLGDIAWSWNALKAVVELHKPMESGLCEWCTCRDCEHLVDYPCKTIQKIEMELM